MSTFNPATFATTLATIGVVIIVASLLSGVLEKRAIPPVAVFLLLGLVVGPTGLGLLNVTLESPALAIIATLSLTLVLFTDALTIDGPDVVRNFRLAALVLGPGTLVTTAIVGLAAWWLLGLSPPLAAILGAALSSTDPVMMRSLLRRPGVPGSARIALGVESGLNDVVVLPIVLVAIVWLGPAAPTASAIGLVGLNVFLLGPAVGALIGFVAVRLLDTIRRRYGVRRDYESLYVVGVAFAAFAAAEALHASGFMAAFAAGLAVALLDVELCDCFHDYGEATSEMFLLFAFVAVGTSLIWTGFDAVSGPALAFALVALFARSLVLWVALRGRIEPEAGRYVVWFGPRALSSLLLVLLPIFAGVSEAASLFPIAALVVLLSVVIHGAMVMAWHKRLGDTVAAAGHGDGALVRSGELITFDEYRALVQQRQPLRILDVRSAASYRGADLQAAGSVRVRPDHAVENAAALALPKHDWLVAYCA